MTDEYFKGQNVIELDLDTTIYKYIPLKYLKLMIENKTLFLSKVSSWEDVYENWFLKEKIQISNGQIGAADNLIPGVYGQCWTKEEESDAMWRIYSLINNPKDGSMKYLEDVAVRIKSTARKIFDAIYRDDKDMASTYIGSVWYLSEEDFREMQDSLSPLSPLSLSEVFATSYFFKRKPFEHEKEVRPIVILPPDHENFGKDGISYDINPDDLIEELVADPRLTENEYNYVKDSLLKLAVNNGKIRQSKLYHLEPHMIQLS